MSTKTTTRRVARSLRLVGVTAAVTAGIAGFTTVDAQAAPAHVAVASFSYQLPQSAQQMSPQAQQVQQRVQDMLQQLRQRACDLAEAHGNDKLEALLRCPLPAPVELPDGAAPIPGGSIFS